MVHVAVPALTAQVGLVTVNDEFWSMQMQFVPATFGGDVVHVEGLAPLNVQVAK